MELYTIDEKHLINYNTKNKKFNREICGIFVFETAKTAEPGVFY